MVIFKLLCTTKEIFCLCRSVFSGFNISNAAAPWELIAKEIPEFGLDIGRALWFCRLLKKPRFCFSCALIALEVVLLLPPQQESF